MPLLRLTTHDDPGHSIPTQEPTNADSFPKRLDAQEASGVLVTYLEEFLIFCSEKPAA